MPLLYRCFAMAAAVVGAAASHSYATKEEPLTTYMGRSSVLDTGFDENVPYFGEGGLVYDGEPFMLGPDEGAWVPVKQVLPPHDGSRVDPVPTISPTAGSSADPAPSERSWAPAFLGGSCPAWKGHP